MYIYNKWDKNFENAYSAQGSKKNVLSLVKNFYEIFIHNEDSRYVIRRASEKYISTIWLNLNIIIIARQNCTCSSRVILRKKKTTVKIYPMCIVTPTAWQAADCGI